MGLAACDQPTKAAQASDGLHDGCFAAEHPKWHRPCPAGLFREALAEAAAPAAPLARLLAELWFADAPPGFGCAGRGLQPADVAGLQQMAESLEAVAGRRAAFVALFLEQGGAL